MRRICSAAALLFLCAATAIAGDGSILASYSFDDSLTDTGPDTFRVYQNARGHVRLSTQIRYSGYRSIELRDVAGDGNFPELQGYFPERKKGELYFHFAMLVVNPDQTLNVALAGPSWFTLSKDGICFWLKTTGGVLQQVSDSIPKRLFTVEPFVWYVVDVRYDIGGGRYDLTIHREGSPEPIVSLKDQPNAANAAFSAVDKFSFVGSVFEDDSNVTYYVDDVVIATDAKVVLERFVAPGRRKLFIHLWRDARALMVKKPDCPPVLSLADFGLSGAELKSQRGDGDVETLPIVKAWRRACADMDDDPAAAAKELAQMASQHPNAPIFRISELMALVRTDDHDAAMRRWTELEPLLHDDVRYGMVAAIADLDRAESWLSGKAEHAEEYYFVLLWKGEFQRAARFAESMHWPERAGDALFLGGSPTLARPFYEEALRLDPNSYWATTKLSDVFFLLGDAANEKVYRQKMYGKLEE